VYQRAIEFLALGVDIVGDLRKGHAERGDQLVLNATNTGWACSRPSRPS
jgi:hypothetical protein